MLQSCSVKGEKKPGSATTLDGFGIESFPCLALSKCQARFHRETGFPKSLMFVSYPFEIQFGFHVLICVFPVRRTTEFFYRMYNDV